VHEDGEVDVGVDVYGGMCMRMGRWMWVWLCMEGCA
jgi:hypothetical protein